METKQWLVSEFRDLKEHNPITVEFAYESDPDGKTIDKAEKDFIDALQRDYPHLAKQSLDKIEDEELFEIALGFREVFINALYHGNYGIKRDNGTPIDELAKKKLETDPSLKTKQVVVRLVMESGGFKVIIMDEGKGFDRNQVADPLAPENLMNHQGRGGVVMNGYAKTEQNTGYGEVVTLERKFDKAE